MHACCAMMETEWGVTSPWLAQVCRERARGVERGALGVHLCGNDWEEKDWGAHTT